MTSAHPDDGAMESFDEVARLLFGVEHQIAKANPDGADLSPRAARAKRKKLERRQAQVGYASNVVGLAAGIGGTAAAIRDDRFEKGGKLSRYIYEKGQRIPKPISGKKGKAGAALAGGALGLQVGNIAGDVVANRVLARAKKKSEVKKRRKGTLTAMGVVAAGTSLGATTGYINHKTRVGKSGTFSAVPDKKQVYVKVGQTVEPPLKKAGKKAAQGTMKKIRDNTMVEKAKPATIEVSKLDEEKKQVFGWASVIEKDGEPIFDLQGDFIEVDDMEKSAYNYVRKSRKAGDMHQRLGNDPRVVGEMIESFAVTPDKREALGLPDHIPTGWWIGIQVEDDQVWQDIKDGKRTGFSVHGTGRRTPVA